MFELGYLLFQGTASEATLVALLSARTKCLREHGVNSHHDETGKIMPKLVAYCSSEVNNC